MRTWCCMCGYHGSPAMSHVVIHVLSCIVLSICSSCQEPLLLHPTLARFKGHHTPDTLSKVQRSVTLLALARQTMQDRSHYAWLGPVIRRNGGSYMSQMFIMHACLSYDAMYGTGCSQLFLISHPIYWSCPLSSPSLSPSCLGCTGNMYVPELPKDISN